MRRLSTVAIASAQRGFGSPDQRVIERIRDPLNACLSVSKSRKSSGVEQQSVGA